MNNDRSNNEIEINFKPEYVHSESVEEHASRFKEAFDKFDMNDIMRKRFSGKTDDEIGIIPVFIHPPTIKTPDDVVSDHCMLYRHIIEFYTSEVFGDPENRVLNLTIPKEMAKKLIPFHNEWVDILGAYGGKPASLLFISVRKKDLKFVDAWVCPYVIPKQEYVSEKDINDNGLILKFLAGFMQSKSIDNIARAYLDYKAGLRCLAEGIDTIGTV